MKKIEVEDYGATLAKAIVELSAVVRDSPLNERALIVLLSDASGVNRTECKAIIRALPNLENYYVEAWAKK